LRDYVQVSDRYPPTPVESLASAVLEGAVDMVPVIGPIVRRLYLDATTRQAAAAGELIEKVAHDVGEELFTPRFRRVLVSGR
jgi:hypothetical protein